MAAWRSCGAFLCKFPSWVYFQRALALDGTYTGDRGMGHGKMACLEADHGPNMLAVVTALVADFLLAYAAGVRHGY